MFTLLIKLLIDGIKAKITFLSSIVKGYTKKYLRKNFGERS